MEDRKLELRLGPPGDGGGIKRGLVEEAKIGERKRMPNSHKSTSSALPNTSDKRMAEAAVVGWPPVRSSRKNLAIGRPPNKQVSKEVEIEVEKGLFVKINMDGVPIGRKIDLKAYDSYDALSLAVDPLFSGLLAAQREKEEGGGGSLGGSGEYTLVYEDNEGDRMLVGDVPWHMFVSTAKRLRVLKTSELSSLRASRNSLEKGNLAPKSRSMFEHK